MAAHTADFNASAQGEQGKGNPEKEPDAKTVTIVINGRPRSVPKNEPLTFERIIQLAFETPPTGEDVQFTVQYTRGPSDKPEGTLVEGRSVKAKEGMEFDVTSTNRS